MTVKELVDRIVAYFKNNYKSHNNPGIRLKLVESKAQLNIKDTL